MSLQPGPYIGTVGTGVVLTQSSLAPLCFCTAASCSVISVSSALYCSTLIRSVSKPRSLHTQQPPSAAVRLRAVH